MSTLYEFVPLPSSVNRERSSQARFDRRVAGTLRGKIHVVYQCEEPIHIGSGFKTLSGTEVVRETYSASGKLVIPGATFKGSLRARYEAITKSCLITPPPETQRKVKSESRKDIKNTTLGKGAQEQNRNLARCDAKNGLCPACILFGTLNQRARVSISHLVCTEDRPPLVTKIPELYGPRLHHVGKFAVDEKGKRFIVNTLYGRKFAKESKPPSNPALSIQAIPKGSLVQGEIRFQNVTPAELGGLLCAAGLIPLSFLRVGAAKSHGLGKIQMKKWDLHVEDHKRQKLTHPFSFYEQAFTKSNDTFIEGQKRLLEIHSAKALLP